ncbi:MAG: CDP-diacylglycerol--glycerol-3-phosphate 3-phosphatidyltransferase [Rhodobacterales bacterium]|nr:CDP-diacylglycerol--glycerol-3-phosphate 3-phosphatidyltransferase [Rhodobacterales bacterium]
MTWNIPNILTIFRLIAAPGVAVMFLYFLRPYADWFALLLFTLASITDWFDGYLARLWNQQTKLGTMLDPIADKAMVMIALLVIVVYSTLSSWLILPAALIMFREVFVSGLREFLGDTAGTLKVTVLAKWKTTTQMIAIAVIFSQGLFEHYFGVAILGMDDIIIVDILDGREEDIFGLNWKLKGMIWSGYIGLGMLWIATALTLLTGFDYFRKAMPYLKDDE